MPRYRITWYPDFRYGRPDLAPLAPSYTLTADDSDDALTQAMQRDRYLSVIPGAQCYTDLEDAP